MKNGKTVSFRLVCGAKRRVHTVSIRTGIFGKICQSNLREGASTVASPTKTFFPSTEQ